MNKFYTSDLPIRRPMPEHPANLEAAFQKARALAAVEALRLESFIHEDAAGSNQSVVENDLRYVADLKTRFGETESQEYKLAKSLEAALYERVNSSKWFGERARMILPSEYDDIVNGVDGVVEFQEKMGARSYLGLAVDVTYSHDPSKKFEKIKERIDEGRLGFVKYFRSTDQVFEGRLNNLPRAVVALNAADATRLVRDWETGATAENSELRQVILYQLKLQLEAYQAYAESLEKMDAKRPPIAKYFTAALRNVSALLADVIQPQDLAALQDHPDIRKVLEQLDKFKTNIA